MAEPWTILKVLNWTAAYFADKRVESARLDAEVLIAHALGTTRTGLYTAFDKPLAAEELSGIRALVQRRAQGEPVAYLVGEQEFWSLPLWVDPRVLIPRRDTETLVEVALRLVDPGESARIVDVCTGSGAVAIALAHERPSALVIATDASVDALAIARRNVERHGLGSRVALLACDLVAPLAGPCDLVVGNPPYVPTQVISTLAPEVRREPPAALDGGPDGLDLVRRLVPEAARLLRDRGVLALEHGDAQGAPVRELFARAGFGEVSTEKDLGARDRVTWGRKLPTE